MPIAFALWIYCLCWSLYFAPLLPEAGTCASLGLPGGYLVQAIVSLCLCLAFGNLFEGWQGKAPCSLVGRASRPQRLGLLWVMLLECPYSELLSVPPWNCTLGGYLGSGWDGLLRLTLRVVPLTCRMGGTGPSFASQG